MHKFDKKVLRRSCYVAFFVFVASLGFYYEPKSKMIAVICLTALAFAITILWHIEE